MYVTKQFDSAITFWDKSFFGEMTDFYKKNRQGYFTDTALTKKLNIEVQKYYRQLGKITIGNLSNSTLETYEDYIVGQVFYDYTETINKKSTKSYFALLFISQDNGKNWVIQDWKMLCILKDVNAGKY